MHCKWIFTHWTRGLHPAEIRVTGRADFAALVLLGNWPLHTPNSPRKTVRRASTPMQHTGRKTEPLSSVNGLRRMRQKNRRMLFFRAFPGPEMLRLAGVRTVGPESCQSYSRSVTELLPQSYSHSLTLSVLLSQCNFMEFYEVIPTQSSSYGQTPAGKVVIRPPCYCVF